MAHEHFEVQRARVAVKHFANKKDVDYLELKQALEIYDKYTKKMINYVLHKLPFTRKFLNKYEHAMAGVGNNFNWGKFSQPISKKHADELAEVPASTPKPVADPADFMAL